MAGGRRILGVRRISDGGSGRVSVLRNSNESEDSATEVAVNNRQPLAEVNQNVPEEESGEQPRSTSSRKRKRNTENWKKKLRKQKIAEGKAYVNTKGEAQSERKPRPVNCENCRFKCSEHICEESRANMCAEYWQLGIYERQKDFIVGNVKVYTPKRSRPRVERPNAKTRSLAFSFTLGEKAIRVCKKFFLKTLCIGHGPLDTALKHRGDAGTFTGCDNRGKHEPANKTPEEAIRRVKQHIESFPTMESHYTRKDSRRLYLDSSLTVRKMYDLYVEQCESSEPTVQPVKESLYRKIFCEDYNISFFHPKKDKCSKCTKYDNLVGEAKNEFQHEYDAHLKRHKEAQAAKEADKTRAINDSTFLSATFDLQSVLQIPNTDASLLYYSRKLCVYNCCVYESRVPNKGHCYCWPEVEGKRGSNEIGTALLNFLHNVPETIREISLFSDTCGGQNRNRNIVAMMLYCVQSSHLEVITHNFLESGHSYMECDSMHSAIETVKKHSEVYTMLDWHNVFRQARQRNPYQVHPLKYDQFYDLKSLSTIVMKNRKKDTNGDTVNWLLVKCFQYRKAEPGAVYHRYSYSEEFKKINVFGRGRPTTVKTLGRAYQQRLPISQLKKQDLLKLCRKEVIPSEVHGWYQALPSSDGVRDEIPRPLEEDSTDDEVDD